MSCGPNVLETFFLNLDMFMIVQGLDNEVTNKMEPTNPNANTFKKLHMSK